MSVTYIAGALSAVKSGFDIAKSIREQVKRPDIDANEVSSQLLLLQQVMLDTQKALNDAQEEIQELKNQLAQKDAVATIDEDLEYVSDGGFYVRKSESATGKRIPYCPICWGENKKLVPLNPSGGNGYYKCGIHTSGGFETTEYRRRMESSAIYGNSGPDDWMAR